MTASLEVTEGGRSSKARSPHPFVSTIYAWKDKGCYNTKVVKTISNVGRCFLCVDDPLPSSRPSIIERPRYSAMAKDRRGGKEIPPLAGSVFGDGFFTNIKNQKLGHVSPYHP